jgi:hypothetical protein
MRYQLMNALQERLGDCQRENIQYSRWKAAVAPLICIAFISFIGFCFFMVAAGQDTSANDGKVVRTNWLGAIIITIFNFFGPVPIVALALLLLIPSVIWLVFRVRTPPIMDTIWPGARPPRRTAKKGKTVPES